MVDLGIDPAVFERAAALLARPLSPTALEKEQLQKGRSQPEDRPRPAASPSRPTAKAKPKAKSAATKAAAATPPAPSTPAATPASPASTAAANDAQPNSPATSHGEPAVAPVSSGGSISAAVAELGDLQKGWKERLHSDEYRKAPVPRVNRKEKVMTEDERHDKMDEIDALEQQLQEAKSKASAITAAANAAASFVASEATRLGISTDELEDEEGVEDGQKENDPSRQAEERVKARRRQEAQESRDQAKREQEAKQAKHQDAEAKAKALERATKERMHARLREEKEKQQLEREELERRQQEKERRAAGADELRLQAAKRVAEREQAERRKSQDAAELEAFVRREQEEENEVKALEGRERTRLRMQQHAQELRAHQSSAEEQQRRRLEAEAAQADEQRQQAQLSQQRARARAAEFRQRSRHEVEERARLEAEEQAFENERSQAALIERQQKRHLHAADPGLHSRVPACASRQALPSPTSSAGGGDIEASLLREVSPNVVSNRPRDALPSQAARKIQPVRPTASHPEEAAVASSHANEVMADGPSASKAVPSRPPRAEPATKQRAARAPPRPPADRVPRQQQGKSVAESAPKARGKLARQSASSKSDMVDPAPIFDAPCRSNGIEPTVTVGDDDEPIRCTLGFFGVNDVAFLGDDDDEVEGNDEPIVPEPCAKRHAQDSYSNLHRQDSYSNRQDSSSSRQDSYSGRQDSYSSRHSTPERRAVAPGPAPVKLAPRAYSQPPPSRPPALPSSRAESPASRGGDAFGEGCCTSPGAASNHSDPGRPAPRAQQQPWKQKAIIVKPADYYLNLLKEARGQSGKKGKMGHVGSSPDIARRRSSEGAGAAEAWSDGQGSYADQMRQRASVVQATQRQEENARQERGYAALQRVQQRAVQAHSRSASTESAPGQLISA